MRADCSLGAHELGRHGMIPARHAPRRSFHRAMTLADQLWQAVQLDQVRFFRFGFRSAERRRAAHTAEPHEKHGMGAGVRSLVLT